MHGVAKLCILRPIIPKIRCVHNCTILGSLVNTTNTTTTTTTTTTTITVTMTNICQPRQM